MKKTSRETWKKRVDKTLVYLASNYTSTFDWAHFSPRLSFASSRMSGAKPEPDLIAAEMERDISAKRDHQPSRSLALALAGGRHSNWRAFSSDEPSRAHSRSHAQNGPRLFVRLTAPRRLTLIISPDWPSSRQGAAHSRTLALSVSAPKPTPISAVSGCDSWIFNNAKSCSTASSSWNCSQVAAGPFGPKHTIEPRSFIPST